MQDQLVCSFMRVRHIRQLLTSIDTTDATIEIQPMLEPLTIEAFNLGEQAEPMTHSQLLEAIGGDDPEAYVFIHTPLGRMEASGFLKGVPLVLFVSPGASQHITNQESHILFTSNAYADITTFIEGYPDESEVLAYFIDLDVEDKGQFRVGELLRVVRNHPPGFPVIPTPHGSYVIVGLILSYPCPKFTLIPWRERA